MLDPELRLDVRTFPDSQRHARIFEMFDVLDLKQRLLLISDYELRPLHARFEERYPGSYTWSQRRIGDGHWEVTIRKAAQQTPKNAIVNALRRSPAFASASDEALAELGHRARGAAIKRHHAVVEQGVQWPYIGMVSAGIIQGVLVAASGRELAVYDVMVDEIFAETALFDRGHAALRHVALTEATRVILFPVEVVMSIMQREPSIMRALSEISAQHFRLVLDRFSEHFSQTTATRIASALLPFAVPGEGLHAALAPLESITQADLALSAGTVKEIVGRVLADFEEMGAIERQGGRIVRLDRPKLSAIRDQQTRLKS